MVEQLIRNEQVGSSILLVGSICKTHGGGLTIRPCLFGLTTLLTTTGLKTGSNPSTSTIFYKLGSNSIFGWRLFVADYVATEIV